MHSEIYRIAYKLSSEGKTPSVALIRARLSTPTSLPMIIQALQQWKQTPELGKEALEEEAALNPNKTTVTTDEQNIEQRLANLEDKVDRILALLEGSNG